MKKILILLFLFAPYLANAQMWFKANAFYVTTDNVTGKWQKCNVTVRLGEDKKVTFYEEGETYTIRALGEVEKYAEKSGVSGMHWLAVSEKGSNCVVDIQTDQKSYIHLVLLFYEDNYAICYNLIHDN